MSWTYNAGLPTDKDMVRFLLGDTDTSHQQVTDEAIAVMLEQYGDPYYAAAALAEGLAATYARSEASISIDGYSSSGGNTSAQAYLDLATRLRGSAGSRSGAIGVPFIGGVSLGEMDAVDSDSDRPPSAFKVGQDSFAGAGGTSELRRR